MQKHSVESLGVMNCNDPVFGVFGVEEWMGGRVDGWKGGRVDEWMGGWEGQFSLFRPFTFSYLPILFAKQLFLNQHSL